MTITYLAFVRMPNEKAHGIQIIKVCEAIAKEGVQLKLIVPGRKTHIKNDTYEYYGIKKIFLIQTVKVFDLIKFGPIGFVVSQVIFGLRTLCHTKNSIVISQDEWVLMWHILFGRRCIYEVHNGRSRFIAKFVANSAILLVANSYGTKSFYVDMGVFDKKILVYPNGVDINKFSILDSQSDARLQVSLPQDKKIILYTGHLYDWKGVDTLARSADLLPEDTIVVFVGGTESDVEEFKKKFSHPKIVICGHKPISDIPLYLRAADILVLPNNKIGESERFTSPMKLFEYLAAEKPIIASDLPSIKEILNEKNAFFFTSGNVQELVNAITFVFDNDNLAQEAAKQAKIDAKKYTWNRSMLVEEISKYTNV